VHKYDKYVSHARKFKRKKKNEELWVLRGILPFASYDVLVIFIFFCYFMCFIFTPFPLFF
jgi:hypothetical protein